MLATILVFIAGLIVGSLIVLFILENIDDEDVKEVIKEVAEEERQRKWKERIEKAKK